MNEFLSYSARVFGQWKSGFGFLTFGLTFIIVLSSTGTSVLLPTWLWVLILLTTLFIGGYRVYRQTADQLPDVADLKIEVTSVQFGGGTRSAVLAGHCMRVLTEIELRNIGAERANLFQIQASECELNTPIFSCMHGGVRLTGVRPHSSPNSTLALPLEIPGRDWRRVRIEIRVDLNETDPKQFVSGVRSLTS